MRKFLSFFCVLFFAVQMSAYAEGISPIRFSDDSIMEYAHPEKDVTMKLKVLSDETMGLFELWQMSAGEVVELPYIEHHITYKTIFVMKGSLDMEIGGEAFKDMGKGYTVHIYPFTPHSMTLKPGTDLMIMYTGDGIKTTPFRAAIFKRNFNIIDDVHEPIEPLDPSAKALNEVRDPSFSVEYRPDDPDEPGIYISSIKIAGYETRGYFEVAHFTIDPPSEGRSAGCHKHKKGFETWIILDGELEMGTAAGEDPVICPAGTIIQANINAVHCPNTVKRAEIIMIYPALFYHYWQHELSAYKRYHPGLKDDPVFREWSLERIDSYDVHED